MSYILISHPVQTEDTRQSLRGKKKKKKKSKSPEAQGKAMLGSNIYFLYSNYPM